MCFAHERRLERGTSRRLHAPFCCSEGNRKRRQEDKLHLLTNLVVKMGLEFDLLRTRKQISFLSYTRKDEPVGNEKQLYFKKVNVFFQAMLSPTFNAPANLFAMGVKTAFQLEFVTPDEVSRACAKSREKCWFFRFRLSSIHKWILLTVMELGVLSAKLHAQMAKNRASVTVSG